jgi:phosphatidylserine/phosphatidylglycerophosphate/cardiolipin synthase-like enzyme
MRKFADRFWGTDWPGSSRPRVYYDPRSLEPDGPSGVLHAKAVVTDDEAVFITLANLTEAALDRNIEIGLLLRDRPLAASVSSHFRGLIDRSLLHPLPMASGIPRGERASARTIGRRSSFWPARIRLS